MQESILRARYREGFTKKAWMQPDRVYKLTIENWRDVELLRPRAPHPGGDFK